MVTVAIPLQLSIATDASGNGTSTTVFSSADVVASGDFVAMATLYEEYRVLGVRAEYYPKLQYADGSAVGGGSGTTALSPHVLAPWREDATPIPTLGEAMVVGNIRVASVNRPIMKEVKADEVDELEWITTTGGQPPAATQRYGVKSFFTVAGGPASSTVQYGHIFAYYAVQFRIRGPPLAAFARARDAARAEEKEEKKVMQVEAPAQLVSAVNSASAVNTASTPAGARAATQPGYFSFPTLTRSSTWVNIKPPSRGD